MAQTNTCFLCHKELEGAIEAINAMKFGSIIVVRFRETSDCNWARCKTCRRVICKACYKGPKVFCCETAFSKRRDEILNGEESPFKKAA